MNEKGFTLVELLAVIAILAILVLIVLPNIIYIFRKSKSDSFVVEVKEIHKSASATQVKDTFNAGYSQIYASTKTEKCPNQLDLNKRDALEYYVEVTSTGKIIKLYATDGQYQYVYDGPELKIEEIEEASALSQLSEDELIKITCDGYKLVNEPEIQDNTLYGIIAKEAKEGKIAEEYDGAHQDSLSNNGDKTIYYYHQSSNGKNITDYNNVLFAGMCWQMIRTTDTGGVKLIYNGFPENGSCLNSRKPSYGASFYSSRYNLSSSKDMIFSDNFSYDVNTSKFTLTGNKFKLGSDTNKAIGKYTCSSKTSDTCSSLRYISSPSTNNFVNVISLTKSNQNYNFGESPFTSNYSTYDSLAYAGYMYNTIYSFNTEIPLYEKVDVYESKTVFKYGIDYSDEVHWNSSANCWFLTNPTHLTFENLEEAQGKYAYAYTKSNDSSGCAHYVVSIKNEKANSYIAYYKSRKLNNKSNAEDPRINGYYTFGDGFTVNENNTVTITNPTTVPDYEWATNIDKYEKKHFCKGQNATCQDALYYFDGYLGNYSTVLALGSSFTYDGTNYKIKNPVYADNLYSNPSLLNNNHYTCLNTSGVCEKLYYSYYYTNGKEYASAARGNLNYIILSNGKGINDALNEMLYADNVNTKESEIKQVLDYWYMRHMTNYTSHLEDSIYCGNRKLNNPGGWKLNGGDITKYPYFDNYNDLSCPNKTDQFAMGNSKAKLKYPVGLMTKKEYDLMSYNPNNDCNRSKSFWLMTPAFVYEGRYGGPNNYIGYCKNSSQREHISLSVGVRPVITLKSGHIPESGNGSKETPYVIN